MTDMKDEGCLGYIGGIHTSRVGISPPRNLAARYPKMTPYIFKKPELYIFQGPSFLVFIRSILINFGGVQNLV